MSRFVWRYDVESRMSDESHEDFLSRVFRSLKPGQIAHGWMRTHRDGLGQVMPRPKRRSYLGDLKYQLHLWRIYWT